MLQVGRNSMGDVVRIGCRAVLFDMDGVLVDSLPQIIEQLRAWATGHRLDPDEVVALSHGRTDLDLVRLAAPHLDPHAEVRAIQARESLRWLTKSRRHKVLVDSFISWPA